LSIIILSSCDLINLPNHDSEEYNISGDICGFEALEGFDLNEGASFQGNNYEDNYQPYYLNNKWFIDKPYIKITDAEKRSGDHSLIMKMYDMSAAVLKTKYLLENNGFLSFWVMLPIIDGYLNVYVDDEKVLEISLINNDKTEWQKYSMNLVKGNHSIRYVYFNNVEEYYEDVYLDDIMFYY